MDELSRRDVLGATAAASLGSLAGCLGQLVEDDSEDNTDDTGGGNGDGNGDDSGNGDDTGDGNGTNTEDGNGNGDDNGEPTSDDIVNVSTETIGSECGSSDDETADASPDGNKIVITGTTPAPDPCHGAVLDKIELTEEELSVVVGVEDTTAENEGCMECVGIVDYDITVELADDTSINTVSIDHVEGGSFGVGWNTVEESMSPSITDSSIETVDVSCMSDDDSDTAEAEFSDGTLTVTGALSSPDPCHEAILASESVEDTQLSVEIDVESTLDEDEMCQDCVGIVEYEATFELEDDANLDSVSVSHVDGETHTIPLEG